MPIGLESINKHGRQVRILIATLSLIAMVMVAMQMLNRPLWGHRPLVLCLSFWALIQSAFFPFLYRGKQRARRFLLSSMTGLLLYLGFPDQPTTIFMFIALVPLLVLEREHRQSEASLMSLMPYVFNAFFLWNITSIYWLMNTDFGASIFTFLLNPLLMSMTFMIYARLVRSLGDRYGMALLIASWSSFEAFHYYWQISFPWLHLGNALSRHPWAIQWYAVTGVFGGTYWILILNYLVYRWYTGSTASRKKHLGWIIFWFLLPIAVSLTMKVDIQEGKATRAGVIQPNYEPHYEKFSVSQEAQARRFIRLSEQIVDSVDVLFFPETSFGLILRDRIDRYTSMKALDAFLRKHPETTLITGLDAGEWSSAEDPSPALRPHETAAGMRYWKRYNSAFQFRGGIENYDFYKKSKLVPGAEKFPYRKFLPFFEAMINRLGGSIYGLEGQEERLPLKSEAGSFGAVICYESVYGQYVSGYIRHGAEALAILTNDGWWDDTHGHRQHLRYASLRAIEQRKWIARSANTGVSCFIDPNGKIYQPTEYEVEAAIHQTIYLNDRVTFYARWGNVLGRIAFFIFCFAVLAALGKYLKPQPSSP